MAAGGGTGKIWLLTTTRYDAIKAGGITEAELDANNVCAATATSATQGNFNTRSNVQFRVYRAANQNAVNLTLDELHVGANLSDLF